MQIEGLDATHRSLAEALVPVVCAAGAIQMRYFRTAVTVETKSDKTPVTVADQISEEFILERLRVLAPDVPIIAEEAVAAGVMPQSAPTFFLVDPLDGTREFVSGRGEFTVNIALVIGETPVFGIIYAPVTHHLFVTVAPDIAVRGAIRPDAPVPSLAAAGIRPARTRRADPDAITVLASRSHMTPATEAVLAGYRVAERRSAGSSLKFCLIADGEADLYPRCGPTREWDTAAGQAILVAAGGSVVDLAGHPLRYGKRAEMYRNPDYIAAGRDVYPTPGAPGRRRT